MWQMIAKGVLGGIGGGLQGASGQSSGSDVGSSIGSLAGKIAGKAKSKSTPAETTAKETQDLNKGATPFEQAKNTQIEMKSSKNSAADDIDFQKREAEFKKRQGGM